MGIREAVQAVPSSIEVDTPRAESGHGQATAPGTEAALRPTPGIWNRFMHQLGVHSCAAIASCPEQERAVPESKLSVACRVLERADDDAYLELRPDQDRAALEHRRQLGHICHVAWYGRRIIAAIWSGAGRMHVDFLGCDLMLSPGTHYVYDAYVRPVYRNQGLRAKLEAVHRRAMVKAGFVRSVCITELFDARSLGQMPAEPTTLLGTIGYYGVGPFRRHVLRLDRRQVSTMSPPIRLA